MKMCQHPDGCTKRAFGDDPYCTAHSAPAAAPSKAIRKATKKLSREQSRYSKERLEFLHENQQCQIGWEGCSHVATEVHHTKGRGKYLLNKSTWLAACRSCHDKATEDSKRALEDEVSQSRLTKKP